MQKKKIRSNDEGYSRHWSSTARICPFLVLMLWQMVLRGAYWNHLLSIYFLEQHIFIFTVNNLMTAHNPGHSFLLIALSSGRATGIFWGTDTEEQCICQIQLQKNTFATMVFPSLHQAKLLGLAAEQALANTIIVEHKTLLQNPNNGKGIQVLKK